MLKVVRILFCRLKYATRPDTESKMMMITMQGGGGRGALTPSVT